MAVTTAGAEEPSETERQRRRRGIYCRGNIVFAIRGRLLQRWGGAGGTWQGVREIRICQGEVKLTLAAFVIQILLGFWCIISFIIAPYGLGQQGLYSRHFNWCFTLYSWINPYMKGDSIAVQWNWTTRDETHDHPQAAEDPALHGLRLSLIALWRKEGLKRGSEQQLWVLNRTFSFSSTQKGSETSSRLEHWFLTELTLLKLKGFVLEPQVLYGTVFNKKVVYRTITTGL